MAVRLKFECFEKVQHPNDEWHVKLRPIYVPPVGEEDPQSENAAFYRYTPAGEISFTTINGDAAAQLEVGSAYYIDIVEAGD